MKYNKYYFATGNKQKIERMQDIFTQLWSEIVFDKIPDLFDVSENKSTAVENALQKLEPYVWKYEIPIVAGDVAIFFDWMNFDPTHAKRKTLQEKWLEEKEITQEEIYYAMLDFYQNVATEKWGEFDFYYEDWWAILYPDGSTKNFSYKRELIMTNHAVWTPQWFFPMCNLYKWKKTWKHYMDWTKEEFRREFSEMFDILKKEL